VRCVSLPEARSPTFHAGCVTPSSIDFDRPGLRCSPAS
jgi:hypothetical protein